MAWFELGARLNEVFRGVLISSYQQNIGMLGNFQYILLGYPCEPTGHVGKENAKW